MASQHVLTCPECGEKLLIEFNETLPGSGQVQDNLVILDHAKALPEAPVAQPEVVVEEPKPETLAEAAVNATDAARGEAHTRNIDLTSVTATGAGGKVTKADVLRAAGDIAAADAEAAEEAKSA